MISAAIIYTIISDLIWQRWLTEHDVIWLHDLLRRLSILSQNKNEITYVCIIIMTYMYNLKRNFFLMKHFIEPSLY